MIDVTISRPNHISGKNTRSEGDFAALKLQAVYIIESYRALLRISRQW